MTRNTSVLSDKDLYIKTANMVEHVRNCEIEIRYGGQDNYCAYFNEKNSVKHKYLIKIANPPVRGIAKYTAFIHELGHVLYETPFYECSELFRFGRGWDGIQNIAHNVYNALEDQRIESHLARNYIAYGKRFMATRTILGKYMGSKEVLSKDNPLFILLAIRFKREDLVKNEVNFNVYKNAMDLVERTDKYGALRILLTLKPYLLEYIDKRDALSRGDTSKEGNDRVAIFEEKKWEQAESNWSSKHQHSKPPDRTPSRGLIPYELQGRKELTSEELEDIVAEGKELGERQFQEVREKLTETTTNINPLPANVKKIDRWDDLSATGGTVKIDWNLSKKLQSTFRKLQTRNKETISDEGYDVDVEQFVDNFISGVNLNECLINNKVNTDASIIITVDGSTSMGMRIVVVRNLVATLLNSIKGFKNIHVKCNVWSSDHEGKIGVTDIESIKDCDKINVTKKYFATPTHMGIDYSRRMLKGMKGGKKLVIMITDGSPNYYSKGRRVARDIYMKRCKKEFQRLIAETPNVICIGIMSNERAQQRMNSLFGKKRVIYVNTVDYAAEKVIKQFKQVVSNALYRGNSK